MSQEPVFNSQEDEINLLELAKTIWNQKKIILKIILGFVFLGIFIAFASPNEYTASSTFIPQTSESGKSGGSLSGLASLAGINLGGMAGGSEIPPSLYPKIVSSVHFKKALLQASFEVEGESKPVTYQQYYEGIHSPGLLTLLKKYTLGLPGLILGSLKSDQASNTSSNTETHLISISEEEDLHFKRIETQLSVTPNEKEGFVSLSFVMPDAKMAAEMAQYAENLLQKEIIQYKIQNAKEQLKFTEERYSEKKKEFEQAHARLANFRDRNQSIVSAAVMNQLQKLESEYNFAFTIYTEIAKQLEQAKLQVSKDTPVLSIIEPVTIPTEKSAPKRPLILVIFTILGVIMGIGYVFGKEFFKGIKAEWNA
jgi:uncharacterized protein involved in exopolysaccharide biosynthesis